MARTDLGKQRKFNIDRGKVNEYLGMKLDSQ